MPDDEWAEEGLTTEEGTLPLKVDESAAGNVDDRMIQRSDGREQNQVIALDAGRSARLDAEVDGGEGVVARSDCSRCRGRGIVANEVACDDQVTW